MRDYIYSLMTDKRRGGIHNLFKFILLILSLAYGLGVSLRTILYKFGIFKTKKVPIKVISVGNLTLGGTGKTPFVMMLARLLKDELKRNVSILIRGYGWDEQAMLKDKLPDIPVIVGQDRVKGAWRAIRIDGSDTAILDDGFQYWELARDMNIILIDSRNPFGNGRLFPRGLLRESKTAIRRADVVIFTKTDKKTFDIAGIKEGLKMINERLLFLEAMHKSAYLYDFRTKKRDDLASIRAKRVILVSGIGDPEYFEEMVKDSLAHVTDHIKYGDHHNYQMKDIDDIVGRCAETAFDILITTEKDAVKLKRLHLSISDYNLKILAVEMEIVSGQEEFLAGLHSLYSR